MAFPSKFQRVIVFLLLICFACVFIGSVDIISSQTIGNSGNTNRSLLVGFALCGICFSLIYKSFYWLNTLNEKGCFLSSLVILFLMAGIMIAASFSARVMQFVDSYDVMDTALFLRKNAEATEELPYIKYIGSFGNNYPVILFESFLIKIIQWLKIQNSDIFLTHLNVVFILSAIVLTWLIIKETKGVKLATKMAVVCLFNPYFYLMVNWTYSMTFSLPIMMGIMYIALRLKKAEKRLEVIALGLFEGGLLGVGFSIRPTTVFPLIAAVLVWFPFRIKDIINRKIIIRVLCIAFSCILMLSFVNFQVDKHFGKIRHLNMPLSFWLMMGSHGDGVWNDEDLDAMMAIQNPQEKAKYALEQTLRNYATLGIDGTINLWYRKLIIAWADGGFFYWAPSVSEGNTLSEYLRGSGARNQLAKIYSQAFRLLMIVGFLLACIVALHKGKIPEIILIMMITIFGCVAFHSIWETNTRYSIPFILPMLVVVAYGISELQEYTDRRVTIKQKRAIGVVLIGFLFIACSNLNTALKEEKGLNFYCVASTCNNRINAPIQPYGFLQLDQEFYSKKPFNTLFFKTAIPAQKSKSECSSYDLNLLSDSGEKIFSTLLSPDQISGQGIRVSFDTISGYDHYFVQLRKVEPEKEPLLFYTRYTYAVDEYRGALTVDGGTNYQNDLLMDVYESKITKMYSNKVRIMVISLIMLSGFFSFFVPIGKEKTYNKRSKLLNTSESSEISI